MTFDSLGEQTSRVAALGPVLENANQINALVPLTDGYFLNMSSLLVQILILLLQPSKAHTTSRYSTRAKD